MRISDRLLRTLGRPGALDRAAALVALAAGAWAAPVSAAQDPAIAASREAPPFPTEGVQAATPAPRCTLEAVQAAAGPGMTIGPIDDLNPALPAVPTGVRLVPASHGIPAYCLITGSVVTDARTRKTANFGFALPIAWNHRFVFSGCGRYCGQVFQGLPSDAHDGLATGNAVAATDDGHASDPPGESLDASWALKAPGVPNQDAVDDFFYRAVHTVTASGQQFVQAMVYGHPRALLLRRLFGWRSRGDGRSGTLSGRLRRLRRGRSVLRHAGADSRWPRRARAARRARFVHSARPADAS